LNENSRIAFGYRTHGGKISNNETRIKNKWPNSEKTTKAIGHPFAGGELNRTRQIKARPCNKFCPALALSAIVYRVACAPRFHYNHIRSLPQLGFNGTICPDL
jgi:hypothetical protein